MNIDKRSLTLSIIPFPDMQMSANVVVFLICCP